MIDTPVPVVRCVKHGLFIRQAEGRPQRIEPPGEDKVITRYHCGSKTEHLIEPE
jgi:hypothetical protein